MLKRWPVGFLCLCLPMKWRTKPLLNCSKSAIVLGGILLNHTLAAPFSVVGNALHITLSSVICNSISVLNNSMWSKGSLELSYVSNCGRQNFWGDDLALHWWMVSLSFESSHPNSLRLCPSWRFLVRLPPSSGILALSCYGLFLHPSGIFSWRFVLPIGLKVWFFFVLVFTCLPTFCILRLHCFSKFFILACQLFHIGQKGLDLLLLHNIWLRSIFCFYLVLRGTLLSLGKMAWMISVSHRRHQTDDAKNEQLSSSS